MNIFFIKTDKPTEFDSYFSEQVKLLMPDEQLVNIISLYHILKCYYGSIHWLKSFFEYYSSSKSLTVSLEKMNVDATKNCQQSNNPRVTASFGVRLCFLEAQ